MSNSEERRLFGIGEEFALCRQSLDEKFGVHEKNSIFYFISEGNALAPKICKGDTLIVDRALMARDSNIIIASYQGEFLCRYFKKRGQKIFLAGEDKVEIEMREKDQFEVFGIVVGLARDFV